MSWWWILACGFGIGVLLGKIYFRYMDWRRDRQYLNDCTQVHYVADTGQKVHAECRYPMSQLLIITLTIHGKDTPLILPEHTADMVRVVCDKGEAICITEDGNLNDVRKFCRHKLPSEAWCKFSLSYAMPCNPVNEVHVYVNAPDGGQVNQRRVHQKEAGHAIGNSRTNIATTRSVVVKYPAIIQPS